MLSENERNKLKAIMKARNITTKDICLETGVLYNRLLRLIKAGKAVDSLNEDSSIIRKFINKYQHVIVNLEDYETNIELKDYVIETLLYYGNTVICPEIVSIYGQNAIIEQAKKQTDLDCEFRSDYVLAIKGKKNEEGIWVQL